MPFLVNGLLVSAERIEQERARLSLDPAPAELSDPVKRDAHLQRSAEVSAIRRALVAQASAADPGPSIALPSKRN